MTALIFYSAAQAYHAVKERLFSKKSLWQWPLLAFYLFFVFIDARIPLFSSSVSFFVILWLWPLLIMIDRFFEYLLIRKLHKNFNAPSDKIFFFFKPALFMTLIDITYYSILILLNRIVFPWMMQASLQEGFTSLNRLVASGLYYFIVILFLAIRWNIFILLYREKKNYGTQLKKALNILRENFGTYVLFGVLFVILWAVTLWGDKNIARYLGHFIALKEGSGFFWSAGKFIIINYLRLLFLLPLHIYLYYNLIYVFYNITQYPRQEDMPFVMRFLVLRRGG
ncbi:MAG TPA: hypothetical protein ENN72_08560 [Firmicutes bacterium]|nr:hypothetical protein [Bacillota bacterium]